ncbi:hypothetical protein BCR36DRAFT_412691 [Piromyces finnis]|uniref:Ketopantoate reductase N-terminal domain-containing protein n=1 Tax=Piromyces finnis TaxID=1754191 RepID=A0A1Y1V9M0_9FUNG|nr:hypothetical protein BCR36DRAFT_412691 [Piromyces finnis]|eukprot:ORX49725.1 hypothetical protein BCR36DRAFT_412691 [Piromyces finnis]
MIEKDIQVLVVGAGSIGRVYGYHLFKGGAKVHFYIREHSKQNLTKYPLRIHRLTSAFRFLNKSTTEKFSDYTITTDTDVASGNTPNLPEQLDYVVFAVPCNRLGEGDWLKTLVTFLNNKYSKEIYYTSPAPILSGMQYFMDLGVDKSQLISGQIGCDSFSAPIPNQKFEARPIEVAIKDNEENNPNEVTVYCQSSQETFGLKAKNIGEDTKYGIRFPLMLPIFMSYTIYGWNFFKVAKNFRIMTLATGSLREIARVIRKKTNDQCGFPIKAISYLPTLRITSFVFFPMFSFAHFFATHINSYDIESLGKANYNGKLGDQTNFLINYLHNDAEKHSIKMPYFDKLVEKYKIAQKK